MRVYHFLNEEYGLKNLKERRLKIATIMELNDPFELLSVNVSDPSHRNAMRQAKRELAKKFGLLCFSEDYSNPVQWAHYADNHKGICIGFEFEKGILSPINYVKERQSLPQNVLDINESLMKKLLYQKFSHWAYEKEWRTFVPLEEKEDDIYYANFSGLMQVKQVIVGCESKISRSEISEALGELDEKVEVFKTRAAFKDFKIVRNKKDSLWK